MERLQKESVMRTMLKLSFAYSLWSWAKVCPNFESFKVNDSLLSLGALFFRLVSCVGFLPALFPLFLLAF